MVPAPAFLSFSPTTAFHGQKLTAKVTTQPLVQPIIRHHDRVVKAVAAKPRPAADKSKKLSKVEGLKTASKQLRYPLPEQLANDEIFINENAVQIMKFHGSYQQDNRDLRAAGQQKKYQFMLRLKMPAGDFPASLYQALDDISVEYGNNTLRATTRCAWQVHGILKGSLKPVFSKIMDAGGSCVGACGDLSRNVMCTPAPFVDGLHSHARWVSRMIGELFAPQTGAFSEIWLDGEKAASLEFWKSDLDMNKVQEIMRFDNGNGVVFPGQEEPIYGETYLPRKFKIGVTVPGDNSIDIYTQDIGVVCIPDASGKVIGYNLIVGGGMGRTHRKETTFARTGDHLGYVTADKLWEALKAIVATQRDHGNRSIRANARMKYLVDKLGIDAFRKLVETYYGDSFEPYRELKPWKYEDWLGWHEQGDGNLFLGLFIENGRIKDEGDFKLKTALRRITDAYEFDMVVTPNQNVILKNITPIQKDGIEAILKEHSVRLATEYDMNKRISMACPAMPLCGLAVTEAERVMPSVVERMTAVFDKYNLSNPVTMRMTGCPNGCARPYMAELGFVGSGPKMYQLWLGGSPNQTRLAYAYKERVKDESLEAEIGFVLDMYTQKALDGESFGDFCSRMGKAEVTSFVDQARAIASEGTAVADAKATPVLPRIVVTEAVTANGVAVEPTTFETSIVRKANARITVARGPAKVTVLDPMGAEVEEPKEETTEQTAVPKTEATAVSVEPDTESTADRATAGSGEEGKSVDVKEEAKPVAKKAKKMKPRPRLTVSDDIMERLKNIAALRDMSASMVADEIISAYLSGVEDEDLVGENI